MSTPRQYGFSTVRILVFAVDPRYQRERMKYCAVQTNQGGLRQKNRKETAQQIWKQMLETTTSATKVIGLSDAQFSFNSNANNVPARIEANPNWNSSRVDALASNLDSRYLGATENSADDPTILCFVYAFEVDIGSTPLDLANKFLSHSKDLENKLKNVTIYNPTGYASINSLEVIESSEIIQAQAPQPSAPTAQPPIPKSTAPTITPTTSPMPTQVKVIDHKFEKKKGEIQHLIDSLKREIEKEKTKLPAAKEKSEKSSFFSSETATQDKIFLKEQKLAALEDLLKATDFPDLQKRAEKYRYNEFVISGSKSHRVKDLLQSILPEPTKKEKKR